MITRDLCEAGKRGGSAAKHKWTEEERIFIRVHYRHSHASRRELAALLGVTEYGVAGQIAKMGIAKRSDRRRWTPEEEEQLAELIPRFAPGTIAKRMHRSVNSVVVKSKRLGCCRRYRDGWFTKKEICEILGVDHKWVQARIDQGILLARPHHPNSPPGKNGSACWEVSSQDLRRFVINYRQDLNGYNVDLVSLVPILIGEL